MKNHSAHAFFLPQLALLVAQAAHADGICSNQQDLAIPKILLSLGLLRRRRASINR